jgi:cytochrome c2
MSSVPRRRAWGLLGVAIAAAVVAVAAQSGGHRRVDLVRGHKLFLARSGGSFSCAFCHTLRAAAANGPFGPDLDNIWNEEPTGFTRAAFQKVIERQIAHPICDNPNEPSRCMPTNLVTGADAVDVAAYVAGCAGRAGATGCRPTAGGLRGAAVAGEHLYATLGCVSCHWTNDGRPLGPPLTGLYGSKVELADGKTVVADETYVIDAILLPDSQIVNGYPAGYMSARIAAEHITERQAEALLAFIKSQK